MTKIEKYDKTINNEIKFIFELLEVREKYYDKQIEILTLDMFG
jgi:hypothetical protein